ncbi:hypothetical protein Nepgr_031363 [Nepenthes gracilis]|uniref:Uncharacterized protein n=1 Tax=Nepenthes gracilis TaxID=150966 RepID=A0AAD3Y6R5_NEPGR|nr:hypothetical protein Nepgr_031363 [Nepenthes gracilis]
MSEIQSKEATWVSIYKPPEASTVEVVIEEFQTEILEIPSFRPAEPEVQLENVDRVGVKEVPSESIEAEVGVVREEEIHEAVEVICPRSSEAEAPVGPVAITDEVVYVAGTASRESGLPVAISFVMWLRILPELACCMGSGIGGFLLLVKV